MSQSYAYDKWSQKRPRAQLVDSDAEDSEEMDLDTPEDEEYICYGEGDESMSTQEGEEPLRCPQCSFKIGYVTEEEDIALNNAMVSAHNDEWKILGKVAE